MKALDKIRRRHSGKSMPQKLAVTFLFLLLGFAMGMLQQFLGSLSPADIPAWLRFIDIRSLFAVLLPWVFTALTITLFSKSPLRAAINVLAFLGGMLIGVAVFCGVFLGRLPAWSEMSGWVFFTCIMSLLALVLWYGRGTGTAAGIIGAVILAFFFLQAFTFTPTFQGFGINWRFSFLPLLLLAAMIGMLWRRPLQMLGSVLGGFALAYVYVLLPVKIPFV